MHKNTYYQFGRAILFGIALFAILAMAPGGSSVVKALDEPEMPPNDARILPTTIISKQLVVERYLALSPDPSYAPGYYDTSVYMLGDVAVGIILPESTGSGENWTTAEQDKVVSEIQDGLNWWKTTGGELASLTFQYDIQFGVPTAYEPISRPSSDDGLWIDEVMSNLSYTTGDYFEQVYAYNNDLRNQYQTDWAFTIFVVDSSNDSDGKFTDGYFAYAYLGGPFMVMTYDNNGWGINDMNKVAAHETGHIFMAGDQYGGCLTTTRYGYLGIENGNCNGNPSLMRDNSLVADSFTKGQIGWQDSDLDNIPDILDTDPVVTLNSYSPNPTANRTLSYNGYVKNPVYPHAVCGTGDWCYFKDVTTQSIGSVNFQVDSGTWNAAAAQDGTFDADVEDFSFTTTSLTPGNHSIKLESINSSGNVSTTWSDAVLVTAPAPAAGVGKYDDTDVGWTYTGLWGTSTLSGPYLNTYHYSTLVNSDAQFQIDGDKFTLTYVSFANAGNLEVYVDDVLIDTIYQYSASTIWQQSWTSPSLGTGVHDLKFVHTTGTYATIDAIQVLGIPTPLGLGIYDDVDPGWLYTGVWGTGTPSGPYANTYHFSTVLNSNTQFTMDGDRFRLTYVTFANAGDLEVYVDDVLLDTISQYSASTVWQQTWTSPSLGDGVHSLKFVHTSGTYATIDAIDVLGPPVPLGAGIYDNMDPDWSYTGTWGASTITGPYADTYHYSTAVGSDAQFLMDGDKFTLTYVAFSNAGDLEVYVDDVLLDTINQYSASTAWQRTWTSPSLGDGVHSLKFVHTTGTYASIDAIQVLGTAAPLGVGIYDDVHFGWSYTGTWVSSSFTGPYANTYHYSFVVGSDAQFAMDGERFRLTYVTFANAGDLEVYVDDVLLDTISQYSEATVWQQTWTSPPLGDGVHNLKFVHATGTYANVDAIEVLGADTTAPNAITTLSAETGTTLGTVLLNWTAPGNDDISGTAFEYLVKYSAVEINSETAWDNASLVTTGVPTPQVAGSPESMVARDLNPGTTYYFAVRAQDETPNLGALGNSPFAEAKYIPPPDNDNFSSAISLEDDLDFPGFPGIPYQPDPIDVVSATAEPDDPDIVKCNAVPDGYSVWYTFSPAESGLVTIDTLGSDYDTVVALWTGTSLTNLQHVACNDDRDGSTFQAELVAYVTQDTTYYIEVDQKRSAAAPSPGESGLMGAPGLEKALDFEVSFTPAPPPPGPGTYDDMDAGWVYRGSWGSSVLSGPYLDTYHFSDVINSNAQFLMTGDKFTLTYVTFASAGNLQVYVDNELVDTISQHSEDTVWQQTWTSPSLGAGMHSVKFVHLDGTYTSIDAIQVQATPTPQGIGIYDDVDPNWAYTGVWSPSTVSGPYLNTYHFSSAVNSNAQFLIDGERFRLTFVTFINAGDLQVYVDDILIDTISQYSASTLWQQTWTSPDLGAGVHDLKFVHANGTYATIDAIEVLGPPVPLGIGIYDDMDSGWSYTGTWGSSTLPGPYDDTYHFSSATGSEAQFLMDGDRFTLTYVIFANAGDLEVYVDDVYLDTISQYSVPTKWQRTWTSPSLGNGVHSLRFVHATGTYANVDAIEVLGP